MTMDPVAIVGAGPYGLAAAAHLRAAGMPAHVFGEAMEFWRLQMPVGMCLRSSWDASHISDPQGAFSLDRYQEDQGIRLSRPVPLTDFVRYGQWVQSRVAPDLDPRRVRRIVPQSIGFRLELSDGDTVQARRVVVATGISLFAHRPEQFAGLPQSVVSHACEERDLYRFSGKRVVVVGSGQSATESAALLSEGGAEVEMVMRAPGIRWLGRTNWLRQNAIANYMLFHHTDVGPPGLSQLVAHPDVFRLLPRNLQNDLAQRAIRPAASAWLRPRVTKVLLTTRRTVQSAVASGSGVELTLSDGAKRHADHVLLTTGYRVNIARYPFFGPELVRAIRSQAGYPELSYGFESSVPGLHFLGAPGAWSFGPLMRFVSGTEYAARGLTRRILATREDTRTGLRDYGQPQSARA